MKAEIDIQNDGNLALRKVFFDSNPEGERRAKRMKAMRRACNNIALSTGYQYVEECGDLGSGSPSPAHVYAELMVEALKLDIEERRADSTVQILADFPQQFLRLLLGTNPDIQIEANGLLDTLLMLAPEANKILKGREFEDLSSQELRAIKDKFVDTSTTAQALIMNVDAILDVRAKEREQREAGMPLVTMS